MNMNQLFRKITCLCAFIIGCIGIAEADNVFYIQNTILNAGAKQTLSVSLANTDEITGFQFDIKLPSGITVNTTLNDDDETVPDISLSERKKSKHQLSCAMQTDGSYRIVVLSMSNQTFRREKKCICRLFKISINSKWHRLKCSISKQ